MKGLIWVVPLWVWANVYDSVEACPSEDHFVANRTWRMMGIVRQDWQGYYFVGDKIVRDRGVIFDPLDPRLRTDPPVWPQNDMTEEDFNRIIDEIAFPYYEFAKRNGGNLVIQRNWLSDVVNADVDRAGNDWLVRLHGGLARRPEITMDGFSFLVCHELGHHFAGFPFYPIEEGAYWAAAEGQADYFSNNICLKNYFQSSDRQKHLTLKAIHGVERLSNRRSKETLKEKCRAIALNNDINEQKTEYGLCLRSALAAKSFADLMANLVEDPFPEFHTTDFTEVHETISHHPNPQCRLDTGFSGSLCTIDSLKQLQYFAIPGFDIQQSAYEGTQRLLLSELFRQERESLFFSCHQALRDAESSFVFELLGIDTITTGPWGYRPACWFRAETIFGPYRGF